MHGSKNGQIGKQKSRGSLLHKKQMAIIGFWFYFCSAFQFSCSCFSLCMSSCMNGEQDNTISIDAMHETSKIVGGEAEIVNESK